MRKYREPLFRRFVSNIWSSPSSPAISALYIPSFRFKYFNSNPLSISISKITLFDLKEEEEERKKLHLLIQRGSVRPSGTSQKPAGHFLKSQVHLYTRSRILLFMQMRGPESPVHPVSFLCLALFGCPGGPQASERRERLPRAIRKGEDETENKGWGKK